MTRDARGEGEKKGDRQKTPECIKKVRWEDAGRWSAEKAEPLSGTPIDGRAENGDHHR
jgi:hypothetical protein